MVFAIVQASRELDDRSDEAVHRADPRRLPSRSPRATASFRSRFPTGGFGGMVTKPWSERTKTTQQLLMESMGPLSKIPGVRAIPLTPPPLPGGGDFPVDLVIASAAEPQQLGELAEPAGAEGVRERAVHLRRRRSEVRPAAGRGRLRSRQAALAGRRPEPGRPDLSTLLGGDYVNRFSIQGRSYKVIPQVKRAERLTPDQLDADLRHRLRRQARAAVDVRNLRTTTEPRELKKFQQLNAVRIQGVIPPPVPLDQALRLPGGRGAGPSCRRASRSTTPASRGSCGRKAAVPRHVPALGDPDLPGARGAVRELPRSVHHPRRARCRWRSPARCCSRSSG